VSAGDGAQLRLDMVLRGRTAVLTAGQPSAGLVDLCHRHRLLLVQVGAAPAADIPGHAGGPDHQADDGWVEVTVTSDRGTAALQALMARPGVSVLVRPDRVVADVTAASRLPACPPALDRPGRRGFRARPGESQSLERDQPHVLAIGGFTVFLFLSLCRVEVRQETECLPVGSRRVPDRQAPSASDRR
jgi:hypothetical protein